MMKLASYKVALNGHELSYIDSGTGPVVLFIHGILGSQKQWRHLVDMMDDTERVEFPMLPRILVGRVQDRLIEEAVVH